MAAMCPHLRFDSSQSAIVRFFGQICEVGMHWVNAPASQLRMVCPDSILATDDPSTWDAKRRRRHGCKYCAAMSTSNPPDQSLVSTKPRWAAGGWDVGQGCFCVYMGHQMTFEAIQHECAAIGVTPAMMESGLGPDVLLQRVGMRTLVHVMPDTVGEKRFDHEAMSGDWIVSALRETAQRSIWGKHDNPKHVIEYFSGGRGADAPAKSYAPQAAPEPRGWTLDPCDRPEVAPKPKRAPKKRINTSRPPADDRWDFV